MEGEQSSPLGEALQNIFAATDQQAAAIAAQQAAAQVAAQAAQWMQATFESKITFHSHGIEFAGISAAEAEQKNEHLRLMGLVTHQEQQDWIQVQLQLVVAKKKRQTQVQAATAFLERLARTQDREDYFLNVQDRAEQRLPRKMIRRDDLRGDRRDMQGLDWRQLTGLSFAIARRERRKSYAQLDYAPRPKLPLEQERLRVQERKKSKVADTENFVRFRHYHPYPLALPGSFETKIPHRTAVAVTQGTNIFWTKQGDSVLWADLEHLTDVRAHKVIKLTQADGEGNERDYVTITAVAAKHGVLVAGARFGEFGIRSTRSELLNEKFQVTGFIEGPRPPAIWHRRGVTHIDIVKAHDSGLTKAIMASVDGNIYTLDCTTGKQMPGSTRYGITPINCTAQSPDNRLRLIVGEGSKVIIAEADGGRKVLHELTGHHDGLTTCAWSDNGIHFATAGWDKLVKIWDARKLTTSNGQGAALTTVAATMAPVRGMDFSPLGSGRRCLMLREEADIITFLDARTFLQKQNVEVLGQLNGGGWALDGQSAMLGVQDELVGGFLTLERCAFGLDDEYAEPDAEAWTLSQAGRRLYGAICRRKDMPSPPPRNVRIGAPGSGPLVEEWCKARTKRVFDTCVAQATQRRKDAALAVEQGQPPAVEPRGPRYRMVRVCGEVARVRIDPLYDAMHALHFRPDALGAVEAEAGAAGEGGVGEVVVGGEGEVEVRNRSATYWRRKAAGAGDFSELL